MGIRKLLLSAIVILVAAMPDRSATAAGASFPVKKDQVLSKAIGDGSIPATLLKDGTVCRTNGIPQQCDPLGKVPTDVLDACRDRYCTLDGLFDLSGAGQPQVFLQWWPKTKDPSCTNQDRTDTESWCDYIALYVLKPSTSGFHPVMKLSSPTIGYDYNAWFLKESPAKLVLMTRCGGSSGRCLVYFDPKKYSLDPITDLPQASYYIEGDHIIGGVAFEDIDKDGTAEIFVEARGRDRTADQGAALFRWDGNGYRLWLPKWKSPPYVVYAQLVAVPGDVHREIVAVLDPGGDSNRRELEVWKLAGGNWSLAARSKLADVDNPVYSGFPELVNVENNDRGIEISVVDDNDVKVVCLLHDGQLRCPVGHR